MATFEQVFDEQYEPRWYTPKQKTHPFKFKIGDYVLVDPWEANKKRLDRVGQKGVVVGYRTYGQYAAQRELYAVVFADGETDLFDSHWLYDPEPVPDDFPVDWKKYVQPKNYRPKRAEIPKGEKALIDHVVNVYGAVPNKQAANNTKGEVVIATIPKDRTGVIGYDRDLHIMRRLNTTYGKASQSKFPLEKHYQYGTIFPSRHRWSNQISFYSDKWVKDPRSLRRAMAKNEQWQKIADEYRRIWGRMGDNDASILSI